MAQIVKLRYSHDAMIDMILADPSISQGQLALAFGYTEPWVSQIMSSDSFKVALAAKREKFIDPVLVASIEEQLEGLARQSMQVLRQNLAINPKSDTALKTLEITTRSLGYGAKAPQVSIQNNVIAYVPEKASSGEVWLQQVAQRPEGAQLTPDEPLARSA